MIKFISEISKLGINPVIDPPEDVLRVLFETAGRSKGPIPVRGHLNGAAYVQTLVRYKGAWRLYINGPMLKASRLAVGDIADIEIEFEPDPRLEPIPPVLAAAFAGNGKAAEAFEALTPSRKKEILRYLGSLKSAESLDRNIEKVIGTLTGDSLSEPPIFMARKKR